MKKALVALDSLCLSLTPTPAAKILSSQAFSTYQFIIGLALGDRSSSVDLVPLPAHGPLKASPS